MLNTITIAGRLTKPPELRTTQNGVSVCAFSVAVERDYAGQGQERGTDFFDCTAWRQGGEFVSKYFHKGDMIIVTGRMQSRDWTDNNGNKRRNWEIQVDHSYFGGSKSDGNQSNQNGGNYAQSGQYGAQAAPQQYQPPQNFEEVEDDGDLPF